MPASRLDIILQAYDRMTAPITGAVNKAQSKLSSFANKANNVAEKSFQTGQQLVASGLAVAAPLVAVTKSAMDFEDSMADVAKVANMDKGSEEFKKMSEEVLNTSKYLAKSGDEVAKLYSSLLAGGTAKGELGQVAKIAGEASVAFDMSQEAAGEAFMTMKNSLGISVAETKKAFDATNAITNKFGGKASEMLDFMSSGGASVARTLKASAPEMEAFGRALTMSGVSASEAGTVMQRFRVGLYKNKEALAVFNSKGGGAKGMQEVFETARKSGDPFKWFQQHKFGEYSSQMALLAMNGGKLGEMLEFVGDEQNYLNSANQEFANRTSTTSFKLNQAKVAFQNAGIKAGTALLPVITRLIEKVTPLIEKFSKWIEKNPKLVEGIAKAAAVFSGLALAGGYLSFIVGGVAKFFGIAARAGQFLARSLGFVLRVVFTVGRAMIANPILLVITAIAVAAFLIIRNWSSIKAFFIGIWDKIKGFVMPVLEVLKKAFLNFTPIGWIIQLWKPITGLIGAIFRLVMAIVGLAFRVLKFLFLNFTPIGLVIKYWKPIVGFFKGIWDQVKGVFIWAAQMVYDYTIGPFVKLGKALFDVGNNIIQSIVDGIKAGIKWLTDVIDSAAQAVRDFFPFSPAKTGPLKDIHKVRLIETVADGVKPAPLVNKVKSAVQLAYNATAQPAVPGLAFQGISPGTGAGANSTFNLTVNLSGGATQDDAKRIAAEVQKQLKQYNSKQARVAFG